MDEGGRKGAGKQGLDPQGDGIVAEGGGLAPCVLTVELWAAVWIIWTYCSYRGPADDREHGDL